MADEMLTPKQVCEEYPIFGSPGSLAERRWRGEGPAYIKTSKSRAGRVFYRRSAIEAWLKARTVQSRRAA
ncbi:AlpA family transcriptional regulator [Streptomyces sp. DH37]|uniref:helix-turn-helix transcriptional regulator n=1 Tax=Streptomyces sp. DH37 TaxID=3040122 RepID=UPI00244346C4|nr:helix-turn-helix domain-containing protein [Streptomyces sp. DH37]MDG9706256.1 helix-turn-helix domain-containing protein [Streptomyces sp. DH37]